MKKLLFLLFLVFAVLVVLGCSNGDSDAPCLSCDGSTSQQGSYAYCLTYSSYYGYECSYMYTSSCNGSIYGEPTCGGYWWQSVQPSSSSYYYTYPSSSSLPVSSSSSLPVSSSSVEYTGGSCNVSDYGTVNIGGQIWMAKNWGCYAPGSKCYNNDPSRCATYGRLYDWSTAMGIDSRYNYEYWNGSDARHQGICPSGWHIPSDADWDRLYRYADGTSGTSSPYDSPTAGRYLKATSGWNSGGNGEDTFGFSALPGGDGSSDGYFDDVGDIGVWWSASEYDSRSAYIRNMLYSYEHAYYLNYDKDYLFSVRCLQD